MRPKTNNGTCVLRAQTDHSIENDNSYQESDELTVIYTDIYSEPPRKPSEWSTEERCYNNLYLIISILTEATEEYFPKKSMTAKQIHLLMDVSLGQGNGYDISVEDVEKILNMDEAMSVILPRFKDGEETRYILKTNAIVDGIMDYSW